MLESTHSGFGSTPASSSQPESDGWTQHPVHVAAIPSVKTSTATRLAAAAGFAPFVMLEPPITWVAAAV